ncbi:hypothetical protein cypCar_00020112, partial [Cyprinus carpio]
LEAFLTRKANLGRTQSMTISHICEPESGNGGVVIKVCPTLWARNGPEVDSWSIRPAQTSDNQGSCREVKLLCGRTLQEVLRGLAYLREKHQIIHREGQVALWSDITEGPISLLKIRHGSEKETGAHSYHRNGGEAQTTSTSIDAASEANLEALQKELEELI